MDDIDKAIDAAGGEVNLEQTVVTIADTGRTVVILYPIDLTDTELLELGSWVLVNLRSHIAELRAPRSPIAIARIMPRAPS